MIPSHEKIRQLLVRLNLPIECMLRIWWVRHCDGAIVNSPIIIAKLITSHPLTGADHNADRNLNCADWLISAPECPLLICYDDPWCPGERGGGAGQFILFLMLKVSVARRPQATALGHRHETPAQWSQQLSAPHHPHYCHVSAQEAFTCKFNSFGFVLMANSDLDRITSLWPSWSFTNLKLLFEFLSAADDIIANICVYKADGGWPGVITRDLIKWNWLLLDI